MLGAEPGASFMLATLHATEIHPSTSTVGSLRVLKFHILARKLREGSAVGKEGAGESVLPA